MTARSPRQQCPAFLRFVRRHPCCVCRAPAPSQAAHIRMAATDRGKRSTGMGEKPSDRWAVPLCRFCHLDAPLAQHRIGEARFWALVGVDPFAVAESLWTAFPGPREAKPKATRAPRARPKVATVWPKRAWPSRKLRTFR